MAGPRFFVPELAVGTVSLPAAEARHAAVSLRLRAGESVRLFDGAGRVADAVLTKCELGGKRAAPCVAAAVGDLRLVPLQQPGLRLFVAGCKGPRLTWLVEKCTELGVAELCFTKFDRSVVPVRAAGVEKLARTALEASKQCGRAWLPRVTCEHGFEAVLAEHGGKRLAVAQPGASAPPVGAWLGARMDDSDDAGLLSACVGPEGGLSERELELVRVAGVELVTLGPHVLRVETAAVACAAAWAGVIAGR